MAETGQRVDKWLFFARVAKSRSLAQKLVQAGAVRVNRDKIDSAARLVRPGDTLTLSLKSGIRILTVRDPGVRRGPASEAAGLFEDITPPGPKPGDLPAEPETGYRPSDRPPTKRERRQLDRLRDES
ncbi:RNA-binding S4 domain-containing protein [Aurantimonas sp. HBX-1]|uniref:RNA-binding S4 domain-containing protein n=1 Tax=Aurantimonas sp. HBX-1 TaxID=2906072 RepID=UPI001F16D2CE|nr:RNA-binding S4 domain-containing protein [Aurantimonas sp. HBX-1]UIJ72352.1 RNA-binding S4 domain-containing protein [Aurantimonas sp. HBX-1]